MLPYDYAMSEHGIIRPQIIVPLSHCDIKPFLNLITWSAPVSVQQLSALLAHQFCTRGKREGRKRQRRRGRRRERRRGRGREGGGRGGEGGGGGGGGGGGRGGGRGGGGGGGGGAEEEKEEEERVNRRSCGGYSTAQYLSSCLSSSCIWVFCALPFRLALEATNEMIPATCHYAWHADTNYWSSLLKLLPQLQSIP